MSEIRGRSQLSTSDLGRLNMCVDYVMDGFNVALKIKEPLLVTPALGHITGANGVGSRRFNTSKATSEALLLDFRTTPPATVVEHVNALHDSYVYRMREKYKGKVFIIVAPFDDGATDLSRIVEIPLWASTIVVQTQEFEEYSHILREMLDRRISRTVNL